MTNADMHDKGYGIRWMFVALIFLATTLNHVDRQVLVRVHVLLPGICEHAA